MRIHYLQPFDENRASSRYRAIIPSNELSSLGHEITSAYRRNADWVIIVKGLDANPYEFAWTGYKKICFDLCDNHFVTEYRGKHEQLCKLADLVTCSTDAMKEEILKYTGVNATVIPDPYEYEVRVPSVFDMRNLVLFWHGNDTSVPPLLRLGNIKLVYENSGACIRIAENYYKFRAVGASADWSVPFSMESTIDGMGGSDVCIIPTENDDWYKCKSPNRLMNAVIRGLFVIANPMPAYEPFKDWMWMGDIEEGLEWFKTQTQEEICRRIITAQEYIQKKHSPTTIGQIWRKVLLNSM